MPVASILSFKNGSSLPSTCCVEGWDGEIYMLRWFYICTENLEPPVFSSHPQLMQSFTRDWLIHNQRFSLGQSEVSHLLPKTHNLQFRPIILLLLLFHPPQKLAARSLGRTISHSTLSFQLLVKGHL